MLQRIRVGLIVTLLSAAAGAVAGVLIAFVLETLYSWGHVRLHGEVYVVAMILGAALGSLLGPIASFGFLRHVPLGRLFGQTIIGAALGGVAALSVEKWLQSPAADIVFFGGPYLGFVVAAGLLWRRFRAVPSASSPPAG